MHAIELPQELVSDLRAVGLNPTDIVLYINSGCNLRCKHCYVGNDLLDSAVYYSASSVLRFVRDLPSLDRVTVLGGEPFFHPMLIEIITAFGQHTCNERRITTNLTICNDDILNTLMRARFRVCVSLDGHTAAQHDDLRGEGAFRKTINNLKRVIRDGHDVEITHTLTAQNIQYFWQFVSLCRAVGVTRLNLHRVSLRGNALRNRHLDMTATEWRALTDAIEKRSTASANGLRVRYEVGFVTGAEFADLVVNGAYAHHSRASYYSPSGGSRVVIFPDQRLYVSSEAFGTQSYIGDIKEGRFKLNISPENELIASAKSGFDTTAINSEILGDDNYPIPVSVSYRRTAMI
jgi:sulfatase maturation enzyme AslB (radical SAM superfamily)